MTCPQCQTDNPAGARFCLNCGAQLAWQCANCHAELPAGARFCMHCGHVSTASTPADEARLTRLAAAAPDPLARKVRAAGQLAGERRIVTVLFADVVGSTALASEIDAEAWMAVMNGAFDRIMPAIYRYEGTVARLVGDGLWAFFGAPVAHEDDPVRAVSAALDLVAAVQGYAGEVRRRHGIDFAMRACLNTGPVVLGVVGEDLRYEYTAMGATVNLAARLKFAAEPMSVLITEDTHRFIEPFFDARDLGPIAVKGVPGPVRVYQVQGARVRPGRLRGLDAAGLQSPMVGRDAELELVLQLCEAVRAGLGRVVLVVGEPGLGKTRLIAEWKAALAGQSAAQPAWVEGHCLSYGQGLAYHLLRDLLRSILGVPLLSDEAEAHAALSSLLEDLFGPQAHEIYPYLAHLLSLKLEEHALEQVRLLDPQTLQAQILAALRRLLQALAARRPLILVVEDLHWADPSSVDLLVRLLPLASTVPLLVCLVTRPDRDAPGWRLATAARELLGGSLAEINLQALSESDSRRLVANLLEIEALSEETRSLILKKAEGNPFFVEEVIRMLIERGSIVRSEGGWVVASPIQAIDIPDNLQGLLLARIDRLPEEVKHTLRVAAVIGRQFPVRVLEQVLEKDDGRHGHAA
jgi:class 3 adenylate cyclase